MEISWNSDCFVDCFVPWLWSLRFQMPLVSHELGDRDPATCLSLTHLADWRENKREKGRTMCVAWARWREWDRNVVDCSLLHCSRNAWNFHAHTFALQLGLPCFCFRDTLRRWMRAIPSFRGRYYQFLLLKLFFLPWKWQKPNWGGWKLSPCRACKVELFHQVFRWGGRLLLLLWPPLY